MASDDEKRFIAYHESGHAVVQYLVGWDLQFVGIGRVIGGQEKWKGGSNGINEPAPDGAVIAYAGPLAEAKIRGVTVSDEELMAGKMPEGMRDSGGWASDAENARICAGNSATVTYVASARKAVQREEIWRAIKALADELCSPARLQETTLSEMPEDIRSAIMTDRGPAAFGCRTAFAYIRRDEAVRLIQHALGPDYRYRTE